MVVAILQSHSKTLAFVSQSMEDSGDSQELVVVRLHIFNSNTR